MHPRKPLPKDFTELIELWPTDREFARALGVSNLRIASRWRTENWIDPKYWNDISKAAEKYGFNHRLEEPGITYALLCDFPKPERKQRSS